MGRIGASVYVVDDDDSAREAIVGLACAAGYDATGFVSATEFLAHQRRAASACLVLDADLPDVNGLALQQRLAATQDALPIVFVTGHGSVPMSVAAIKAGAVDFLMKPFDADALLDAIERALEQAKPRPDGQAVAGVVGTSKPLCEVLRQIEILASTDTTVLIHGETGTGKECLARALHELSSRRARPFVKVNCAAIPAGLLESELMGHERGAFTGAVARRIGRFELAQEGTIFLDEIGELPIELQPKLLRILQEREFERVGSEKTVRSNARVVAATNRDLKAMVASRTFREDLYYRLSVFPIVVPPLRDRKDDIPNLARHFVAELGRRFGRPVKEPSTAVLARLMQHHWPGNIRELQNVLERAAIMARGGEIDVSHGLHAELAGEREPGASGDEACDVAEYIREQLAPEAPIDVYAETHKWVDRILFRLTLNKTGGNRSVAARLMGISRQTLRVRLRSLGQLCWCSANEDEAEVA